MAGKLRLRVALTHVVPFWMLVDRKESPLIVDVQKKIQQKLENVTVESLSMDGCLLPMDETSELLRDNDLVHVNNATKSYSDPPSKDKKHRKRKHLDEDEDCVVATNQDYYPTTPVLKRKKEILREKHDSDGIEAKSKKNEKSTTELCTSNTAFPGNKEGERKECKEKKEKRKKKSKEKFCIDNELEAINDNGLAPLEQSSTEEGKKAGIEETGLAKGNALQESPSPSDGKKKKRRRHHKKKSAKDQADKVDSAKVPTVTKQTPVEMRLPKWQKSQNKKIVFSSESGDEADSNNPNRSPEAAAESQNVSVTRPGTSDNNTSFSKCYPESPFLQKEGSGKAAQGAQQNSLLCVQTESSEDLNGTTAEDTTIEIQESDSTVVKDQANAEWNRNKQDQYVGKEINVQRRGASVSYGLQESAQYYSGSDHEQNHAKHLETPTERGVTASPYVTAKRLANGAMLYTRCAVTHRDPASSSSSSSSSSAFKASSAHASSRPSPRAFSKQQQLETINTNRSTIIENPPHTVSQVLVSKATESIGRRNGDCTVNAGTSAADCQETDAVITQDYSVFPDLTSAPKEGDRLAYKVLEMGEDYTPGMSDFKEAEVLMYDPSSQNVSVRLLQASKKKRAPGKFDIDETPDEEEVTIELSSMFEPKLISSH